MRLTSGFLDTVLDGRLLLAQPRANDERLLVPFSNARVIATEVQTQGKLNRVCWIFLIVVVVLP